MNLKIQLICLAFSFLFGVFLYFIYRIHSRALFHHKGRLKYFFQFIVTFSCSFLYFIILNFLNNGVLHCYFLLLIMCGFLISYHFSRK